ncbi:hypothetical protein RQN30_08305 [Arcanobacterium hippocoleae]
MNPPKSHQSFTQFRESVAIRWIASVETLTQPSSILLLTCLELVLIFLSQKLALLTLHFPSTIRSGIVIIIAGLLGIGTNSRQPVNRHTLCRLGISRFRAFILASSTAFFSLESLVFAIPLWIFLGIRGLTGLLAVSITALLAWCCFQLCRPNRNPGWGVRKFFANRKLCTTARTETVIWSFSQLLISRTFFINAAIALCVIIFTFSLSAIARNSTGISPEINATIITVSGCIVCGILAENTVAIHGGSFWINLAYGSPDSFGRFGIILPSILLGSLITGTAIFISPDSWAETLGIALFTLGWSVTFTLVISVLIPYRIGQLHPIMRREENHLRVMAIQFLTLFTISLPPSTLAFLAVIYDISSMFKLGILLGPLLLFGGLKTAQTLLFHRRKRILQYLLGRQ